MNSFYSEKELEKLGFKSVGEKVFLSKKASIYSPEEISIGNNVRIDDFCILSGKITIGSNIHISAFVALYGSQCIVLEDFTGISPMSVIYSAMDDFSGNYLIGPVHPDYTTNVTGGQVIVRRFAQIGSNTVVFPSIEIGEGAVIGACSLVKHHIEPWSIYFGIPAVKIKERSRRLMKFINEDTGMYNPNPELINFMGGE